MIPLWTLTESSVRGYYFAIFCDKWPENAQCHIVGLAISVNEQKRLGAHYYTCWMEV